MLNSKCVISAAICCLLSAGCKKPAEAPPPPAATRTDSWIGVELTVQAAPENEIRDNEYSVQIAGIIPTMPADGVLKEGDILLRVGAKPVTDIVEAVDAIRNWPAGQELEVTVRRGDKWNTFVLRPQPKPSPTELLRRVYVGKPLPPFRGIMISTAVADGQGGIVPESQCVMEDDKACPKFGRLGQTSLAVGKATVLLFWTQNGAADDKPSEAGADFALLKRWQERFGAQGLEIVAITRDPPRTLAPFLKKVGPQPRMALVSMWLGNYGSARLAESYAPCVLILDEKGVVRAAAGTLRDIAGLGDRTLPELLGTPQ